MLARVVELPDFGVICVYVTLNDHRSHKRQGAAQE